MSNISTTLASPMWCGKLTTESSLPLSSKPGAIITKATGVLLFPQRYHTILGNLQLISSRTNSDHQPSVISHRRPLNRSPMPNLFGSAPERYIAEYTLSSNAEPFV
ncbi:uncharacterized protein LOC134223817 [Armigeres subalbatus]|uniref:uncharacterized protein LOC134223817 n=1 Tax=Armigeres subalbatus TaxID=124917 RepID=UPI002ED32719